jgi:serine/threonine protein kinase
MDDATLATLRAELAERHGIVLTSEQLGKGSFGVVVKAYAAGDETARRAPLAVKFLTPATADEALRHLETLPSLALDAPSARSLRGSCVLPFVHFGVLDGGAHAPVPFLVSRYIHSATDSFRDFVTDAGTDMAVVQRYVGSLLRALAWAEEHGLVHRDVKPRNVLWDSAARVAYLADWGLVDVETALARADPDQPVGDADSSSSGGGGSASASAGRERSGSASSSSSSRAAAAPPAGDDADEPGHPALAAFARAVEAEQKKQAAAAAAAVGGGADARDRDRRGKGGKRSQPATVPPAAADDPRSGSDPRDPPPSRVDPRSEEPSSTRGGGSSEGRSAAAAGASSSSDPGGGWPKTVERTVVRAFRAPGGGSSGSGAPVTLSAAVGAAATPAVDTVTASASPPAASPSSSSTSSSFAAIAAAAASARVVDFPAVLQQLPSPEPAAVGGSASATVTTAAGAPSSSSGGGGGSRSGKADQLWARHPDEQDSHALRVLDREVRAQERAAAEAAGKRGGGLAPSAGAATYRGVACKRALEELGMTAAGRRVARKAGTPGFRPPEVLLGSSYQTGAVDAWSAGMIALCLLARRYPLLPGRDDWVHLHCLHRLWGPTLREAAAAVGRHIVAWPTGPELGAVAPNPVAGHLPLAAPDMAAHPAFPAAFDLTLRLCHPDPAKRLTASAAIAAHPFLTTPVDAWGSGARVPRPLAAAAAASAAGVGGERTGAPFDERLLSKLPPFAAADGSGSGNDPYSSGAFATRHGVAADVIPWSVEQLAWAYCAPDVAAGVVAMVADERRRSAAAAAAAVAAASMAPSASTAASEPRARRREERKPSGGTGAGGGEALPAQAPSATVTAPSAAVLVGGGGDTVDDADVTGSSDSDAFDGRAGQKRRARGGGGGAAGDASTAGSGSAVRGRDGARAQAEDAERLAAEFEKRGGEDAGDDSGSSSDGGVGGGGGRRAAGAGAAGAGDGSGADDGDGDVSDSEGHEHPGGGDGARRRRHRRFAADATATAVSAPAADVAPAEGGASESF